MSEGIAILRRIEFKEVKVMGSCHPDVLETKWETSKLDMQYGSTSEGLRQLKQIESNTKMKLGHYHPLSIAKGLTLLDTLLQNGRYKEVLQRCVEMDLMLFSALDETAAIVFPLLSIEIMLKFILSQKEEEGEKILKIQVDDATCCFSSVGILSQIYKVRYSFVTCVMKIGYTAAALKLAKNLVGFTAKYYQMMLSLYVKKNWL